MKKDINSAVIKKFQQFLQDEKIPINEKIDQQKDLVQYEIDSILYVKFAVNLENEFQIEFDDRMLDNKKLKTLNDIIHYLKMKCSH